MWVMSGKPLVQSNQIYNNKDSGMVFMQKVGIRKVSSPITF